MVKSFFSRLSNGGRSPMRVWLVLLPPILLILGGVFYFVHGSRYISTDNAYVKADKVAVSAEVTGRLVVVAVEENQVINKGQLLFRIDDQPYKIAVDRARATLKNVVSDFGALKARYRQKQAELKKAQVDAAYFDREYKRWASLANTRVASQAKLDQARHDDDGAHEDQAKIAQELQELVANLEDDPNLPLAAYAPYKEAQAGLEKAQLDLGRTVVTAPVGGIVSKTGNVQVGNYAIAGVPMLSIVKTDHLWIEANMKETDITHMRVGQKADAEVDTYSGHDLKAVVSSIAPATGAEFSILPPQNATGNWVKVVQRVPVRLELEDVRDSEKLRAGMSVTVTVDTGAYYALPVFMR
jgi:membrane fusion protein (multidrug efflux system)